MHDIPRPKEVALIQQENNGSEKKAKTKSRLVAVMIPITVWTGMFSLLGTSLFVYMRDHWPIGLTMVFGSMVAGGTAIGGGAVAFPVLTKVLAIPSMDARTFSLAIQSFGMTAASIVMILLRYRLEWRIIRWTSLGGVLGIYIGAAWIAHHMHTDAIRICFTMIIAALGYVLYKINQLERVLHETIDNFDHIEKFKCVLTGVFGGIISGLIGNGIDIIAFSLMVLHFRLCEKISTPTSVVIMAINSIVGILVLHFGLGEFHPHIQHYWFAAIPFVVVGAPLGAIICNKLHRKTILRVLICLISIEFISSMILIPFSTPIVVAGGVTVAFFLWFFHWISVHDEYA